MLRLSDGSNDLKLAARRKFGNDILRDGVFDLDQGGNAHVYRNGFPVGVVTAAEQDGANDAHTKGRGRWLGRHGKH